MSLLKVEGYSGDSGVYAAVELPEAFSEHIFELCDYLGLERPPVEELHCTVMYSPEETLRHMPTLNKAINALVSSVQHWVGHNGKTYVVADVQSMALIQLHSQFAKQGAKSTFAAYRPHITLGKIDEATPEFDEKIENLNWSLKDKPLHVAFMGCVVKDIRKDGD